MDGCKQQTHSEKFENFGREWSKYKHPHSFNKERE